MSVYNKELIIDGQAVLSPEQQVYKNMKDITELKGKLQTWYASSVALNSSDTTILRSNTNVPDEASSGLLIDPNGLMFSITGGDDTTLLITYYASIKGPQGEQGTPGASSNDKGTYLTHVEPTLADGIYTLSTGNIDNFSTDSIPVQVNDIIVYIDSNDQPTSVYLVASISGTTLTLTKEGDYAKGKQLYQHNITFREYGNTGQNKIVATFSIINDNDTPITTMAQIIAFLDSNNIKNALSAYNTNNANEGYPVNGRCYLNSVDCVVVAMWELSDTGNLEFTVIAQDKCYFGSTTRYQPSSASDINDNVITL